MTDVQKIGVSLSASDIVIEPGPGNVTQLIVTMINGQETPDRLLLEVEGIDVEWYAIPVSAVNVAPGAQASERIIFRVSRDSANRAGSYPFLVRVQAMETGEVGVAQATLTVKPFTHLQVELDIKRAISTFFHPLNDFNVSVSNQGNVEETVDLYASDPDDGIAYEFDTDRATIKPGQTVAVPLAMRPKVSSVLGGTHLYGFTVTARSVDDSYVSANAHGQLEKHALISPLMGIFLLLLLFGAGGYYFFRPVPAKPPVINSFNAVPTKIVAGTDVMLSWDVSNAQQIIIRRRVGRNGEEVNDPGEQPKPVGSLAVTPKPPLTGYTLVARGQGSQKDVLKEIWIEVTPPPPTPSPTITYFHAEPAVIHPGDVVQLSWEARNYTQAILDPGNITLSQYQKTQTDTPDQDKTYTLRVIGAANKPPAEKKASVQVMPKDQPIAVADFKLRDKTVYIGGKARLKWYVKYARTVHLSADNGGVNSDVARDSSLDVKVDGPTTFTLTATDSAGQTTTKQITVNPIPRPLPPPPVVPPSDNGITPGTNPGTGTTPTTPGNTPTPNPGTTQ